MKLSPVLCAYIFAESSVSIVSTESLDKVVVVTESSVIGVVTELSVVVPRLTESATVVEPSIFVEVTESTSTVEFAELSVSTVVIVTE